MLKVGLIGCGNISGAYLQNNSVFQKQCQIVKCADQRSEAARATAEKYGLTACTVEEVLADPAIDIILNLTTPQSHTAIDLMALTAGKHVYSEKPFALNREDGRKVLELAKERKLRVGCAPDTFLGGAHQSCRQLIDSGLIGKVTSGMAVMLCPGHESWHPAPGFYYQTGGGPLFDMGPYYLTALVNLLGGVESVTAFANRKTDLRVGTGVNVGKTFAVEIDTHLAAVLRFRQGAVITLTTSFDVYKHSCNFNIELQGVNGALHVPDPNCFGGTVKFFQSGLTADWATAANAFIYNDNMRGIGLADMADAISNNRPHRANADNAFHVLDVMCAIVESAASGEAVAVRSAAERPQALAVGLKSGEIN